MPIQPHKQPFTLEEKIIKAQSIISNIHYPPDAEFMRIFLFEMLEKALKRLDNSEEKNNIEKIISSIK